VSKPLLAVGLLAVMVVAWSWALLAPGDAPVAAPGPHAVRPALVEVPDVRLGDLSAARASRPVPTDMRNPFLDPLRPAPHAPVAGVAEAPVASGPAAPATPAVPAWPRLALIGLAETRHGGGVVRTAIVAGPRGVTHARPGDVLEGVYRLERIGAAGIDVRLVPEDRVIRLALPP
jgi:hypothetical protein